MRHCFPEASASGIFSIKRTGGTFYDTLLLKDLIELKPSGYYGSHHQLISVFSQIINCRISNSMQIILFFFLYQGALVRLLLVRKANFWSVLTTTQMNRQVIHSKVGFAICSLKKKQKIEMENQTSYENNEIANLN